MRRTLSALCLSTGLGLGLTALPAHAADVPVTPTAPTVVDECGLGRDRVTIPDIAGVQYLLESEGQIIRLTPGEYAGIAFIPWEGVEDDLLDDAQALALPDAQATITVEALEGHALTDGAPTSFEVALSSTPCASSTPLVTATSTQCGTITFTNPAGNPQAIVLWADADSFDDYAELVVPAGTSRTVSTSADEIDWFALDASQWEDEDWADQFDGATARAATVPDHVATQEDRDDLSEAAELLDSLLDEGLGGGFAAVDQACAPVTGEEPAGTDAPTTPEIPVVVQTDGVAQHLPLTPLALGGLSTFLVLAGAVLLRRA